MTFSNQCDLLSALGLAVLEQTASGVYQLVSQPPTWFDSLHKPGVPLTDSFPFLEVFLPDAEDFWNHPDGRDSLRSDLWTQQDHGKAAHHLCAIALLRGEQKLLILESAPQRFDETQATLHYAHEASLAKQKLAEATEAKTEFLARMSHEIRTPMNALLGMAELLSETTLTAEQVEYVRVFRRAGDNLLAVVNDILDFSKIEAGQIELEHVAFDLRDVLDRATELLAPRANAKHIALHSHVAEGVPATLVGDPNRLRQVLLNLLGNAIKFTDKGEVRVEVKPDGPMLHFAVSDTGIGIPADKVATIFESFTQADASTTRQYGGTGLGLAISKRFVELMGGRIWAESTPGRGTTIHFVASFGVAKSTDRLPATRPISPVAPLKILLADDSEDNRTLIHGYLKRTGCTIDDADNGAQALEKFKATNYDVVLTDADMPLMDGYTATKEMRRHEKETGKPPTPILLLTAHVLAKARQKGEQSGCTNYLTKPLQKTTLLEALSQYSPAIVSEPLGEVEPWLKAIIPGYLEKRRNDLKKIFQALDQSDYATIQTLGHQIAGTGASYGFTALTEIGAALETAAMAEDPVIVRREAEKLKACLANL